MHSVVRLCVILPRPTIMGFLALDIFSLSGNIAFDQVSSEIKARG